MAIKNIERFEDNMMLYKIQQFAKKAESKKPKNKGLLLNVDLELEDQRILWFR